MKTTPRDLRRLGAEPEESRHDANDDDRHTSDLDTAGDPVQDFFQCGIHVSLPSRFDKNAEPAAARSHREESFRQRGS